MTAVFGLADDLVGKDAAVVLDDKADLKEWRAPAIKGKHGQNEYNWTFDIDGGGEGRYWLYFRIDVFEHTEDRIQPLQGQ